jgi:amino-acid N-acetyltransferase
VSDSARSAATVRAARAGDVETILRLARDGGVLETGIAGGSADFIVAERGATIAGTCGIESYASDGLLRTVVVDREFQGQGVGQALVEEAVRRARARGLGSLYLLTTSAASFFTKLGFQVTARDAAPAAIRDSWEFRAGCPSSAVLMSRSTSAH